MKGGDVNERDSDGGSMLSFAVNSGNIDVVKALFDSGCRVDDWGDLFLHNAAEMNRIDLLEAVNGNVEALRFYIEMNGDLDCVDYNGLTPLHYAAAEGHDHGVQVDLVDNLGYTSLHCAIEAGHTKVALSLISYSHGAKGNLKSIQDCPTTEYSDDDDEEEEEKENEENEEEEEDEWLRDPYCYDYNNDGSPTDGDDGDDEDEDENDDEDEDEDDDENEN
ncbi:hypothetical protein IFM89_018886 [Coptis chinensis]|uniref:Uncharacterized protein n=1 Tax=Coptis chinensis TaxID=261450 RepID=A0A835HBR5_9MAGN|nr:hypothetical protein IFM89_018886 [Coptis chinensis]